MKNTFFEAKNSALSGFWMDEYSGGFRLSKDDRNKKVDLGHVIDEAKNYLKSVGRPIPEADTLLIVGDAYYEINFARRTCRLKEHVDTRPMRASFPGLNRDK